MSKTILFHLDENVNNAVAEGLRRRGINVTTTGEVGLIGAPDEIQLQFATTHGRVIFTQDTDFLRLNQAGVPHSGIAFCRKGTRSIGEIINGLTLIWELLTPEEMIDRLEYI